MVSGALFRVLDHVLDGLEQRGPGGAAGDRHVVVRFGQGAEMVSGRHSAGLLCPSDCVRYLGVDLRQHPGAADHPAISANIANFTMALSAVLTIRLNRKVLPKEFRSPLWKEIMLWANVVFFGFFFTIFLWAKVFGFKL